jgi:hypothetical protein
MPSDTFNWGDIQDNIVVQEVTIKPVAVYTNHAGDIVIRQQPFLDDEEDQVIVIPRARAKAVADAIRSEGKKRFEPQ